MNKLDINQTTHQQIIFCTQENIKTLKDALSDKDAIYFEAEENEVFITKINYKKTFLIGLGEKSSASKMKKIARKVAYQNRKKFNPENTSIQFYKIDDKKVIRAILIGLFLGTYEIQKDAEDAQDFTHPLWNEALTLSFDSDKEKNVACYAQSIVEGQFLAMDLLNLPPNEKNAEILAEFVQVFADNENLKCTVLDYQSCVDKGLSAFLSVNQGSAYQPAFIILEYIPENPISTIGLIGKCITFDTGGISIKPSQNMHYMKSDMGGATTVLGTMLVINKLQVDHHVIAMLPATDNAVSADAYLPGDVIQSYSGKTIEVINTDAEGRMTLADALSYMEDVYKPDIMIDIATLTGSAVRTLGYKAAAILTENDVLHDALSEIGNEIGEKVWRLPLWDEFLEDIQSDVADYKHISNTPMSDVIYAGKFLQQFTNQHPKWVHLDIAGVAFGNNDYSKDKSATGYGVELLTQFIFKQ